MPFVVDRIAFVAVPFVDVGVWCLFICKARWSEREKHRSQCLHLNGLLPVCLRKCLVNSSERANRHSQPCHVHWYGFSPVCVRWCAFKCDDFV